jgi:ribosomal protein S18 acetylase RimI-like enzyme
LVAEQRGIVGFAILRLGDAGPAWLDAIAVTPSVRGCGVGQLLLASVELEAAKHGARQLGLATADSNLAALDLFLRAGFVIQRRMPRYYERGQDAVEMEKRLVPA